MFRNFSGDSEIKQVLEKALLTTPFSICRTWTAIDNLKDKRRRVASIVRGIKRAVGIRAHQLKALAAGEVVVLLCTGIQGWYHGPELRIVIAIRCREVASKGKIGWVGA